MVPYFHITQWFPGSIEKFDQVQQAFIQQFSMNKDTKRTIASLLIIKQNYSESLRGFLKLFNEARL